MSLADKTRWAICARQAEEGKGQGDTPSTSDEQTAKKLVGESSMRSKQGKAEVQRKEPAPKKQSKKKSGKTSGKPGDKNPRLLTLK